MTAGSAVQGGWRVTRTIRDAWRRPNPLWIRELRQASRIKRTPFVLMTVTILAALVMGGVCGVASDEVPPAELGGTLFQVFFSMAFFVVALVGPAVGANNIAAEREGRTLEPLILTGFPARAIARGKFFSALTSVLQYLAILVPVGALPFLFGGVSATEVILAFACLVVFSILAVGYGLAVGSAIPSARSSIVVTIISAAGFSMAAFYVLGILLSAHAHGTWRTVPSGPPVWLPTALANAPWSAEYVVLLLVQPFVGAFVMAWFFHEVTTANMSSAFKDRSGGLLRWFTWTTPMVSAALCAGLFVEGANWLDNASMRALLGVASCVLLATLLFQAAPRRSSKPGPDLMQSMTRVLGLGLGCFALVAGLCLALIAHRGNEIFMGLHLRLIGAAAGSFGSFLIFVVGLGAFLRTRTRTVASARIVLLVSVLLAIAGPFVLAVVAGVLADESRAHLPFATPSPAYLLVLPRELASQGRYEVLPRMALCGLGWASLGLVFFFVALWRESARAANRVRTTADGSPQPLSESPMN